jgi:spore germination cell wall hydrolase CwlJ-like protein
MSRKTNRAAAIAMAVTMFFTLANTDGSGAFAQEIDQSSAHMVAEIAEPGGAAMPRFVASEVVQPLPETAVQNAPEGAIDVPLTLGELVTEMPVDGELSRDMRCLAQAIYFEARGEPLDGQLAVARVVINRAESDAFPDDYCGVVTQRAQFSFVKGGLIPAPNTSSSAWKRAIALAKIAHQELWDSPVKDALFFHATYVKPGWAHKKVARATLARHIFYR